MLRVCRHIFVSGKDVVLDSEFFVSKFITQLEAKGVYVVDMIKQRRYWPKVVTVDLIDTNFEDNQVGGVVIIEARTEDNKLFKIFCMKEPDYMMKIMSS